MIIVKSEHNVRFNLSVRAEYVCLGKHNADRADDRIRADRCDDRTAR